MSANPRKKVLARIDVKGPGHASMTVTRYETGEPLTPGQLEALDQVRAAIARFLEEAHRG